MDRQSASKKTFGMVMVIVALLLAACGSGDGESTPTPPSGANQAVPTLPSGDGTAAVTEEISEDDLTVVTPNIPATQDGGVTDLTAESTPGASGTPPDPGVADVTSEGTAVTETTPAGTTVSTLPATSGTATQVVSGDSADASPPATVSGATFNTAGDGTGGSGQPGERDSNTGNPAASPAASPVAVVEVDGCEVTTVPPFTGTTNAYVTSAEVFFRQGPGTDCTPVYETPLGEGQAVDVIGGPVSQAADGTLWVQVEVDGVPGWVSFDFVEPAG